LQAWSRKSFSVALEFSVGRSVGIKECRIQAAM